MEQTILEVIAAHARRIPEKIALISENELHFPICTTENLTEKLIDK